MTCKNLQRLPFHARRVDEDVPPLPIVNMNNVVIANNSGGGACFDNINLIGNALRFYSYPKPALTIKRGRYNITNLETGTKPPKK